MKITFNVASLAAGGVERLLACMANYWVEKGTTVNVLTYNDASEPSFFELDPNIEIAPMSVAQPYSGLIRALLRNIASTLKLRKEIVKIGPDCLITFGEPNGVRAVLAAFGTAISVIIYQPIDPAEILTQKNGKIWASLRRLFYPWADAIVVPTRRNKEYFSDRTQRKTWVIPNPVPGDFDYSTETNQVSDPLPVNTILTVGRLVTQKRYDLLLKAFAIVAQKNECHLVIVGDGPLKSELEHQIYELGLVGRVTMPGYVQKPWYRYKNSKMYALSSEWEGFPMALLEAMATGLPIVSFDCPTGPREVIRDGIDGVLVPQLDVEALASAMEHLLADQDFRDKLATNAAEVKLRFGMDAVMNDWTQLAASVCRRSNRLQKG